jgi:hypothetical protein
VLPGCTFCTIGQIHPIIPIETHIHFYSSDCTHAERYWTAVREWAQPHHNATYTVRDRIYCKINEKTYSIVNTLLREVESTLWKCRLTKTIQNIADLKKD